MADTNQNEPKPDGAAFDDYFESLGKKAQNLSSNDNTNGAATNGLAEDEDQKVVDEIESLCMNCHENVCYSIFSSPMIPANPPLLGNHPTTSHTNSLLPRDHSHVLFLSALQLQEFRDSICRRDSTKRSKIRIATHQSRRLLQTSSKI